MDPETTPQAGALWKVTTNPGGGWVPWRAGTYLPGKWRTVIDGEPLPYLAELEFSADTRGPHCEAITFREREGGDPIVPQLLRKMKAGALVEHAIASAAARGEERDGELRIRMRGLDTDAYSKAGRPSRERMSDEHLRQVADVYLAASEKPTQAVWEHFGFAPSYSTVARWVEAARKRGLIPRTTRGRTSSAARKEK